MTSRGLPPWPWLAAVVAQVAAAALVLYLQTLVAKQRYAEIEAILQRLCDQTLIEVVTRLRQALESASRQFVESAAVDNEISIRRDYDIQRVEQTLSHGLQALDFVDRFFLWSDRFPPSYVDQALFIVRTEKEKNTEVAIGNPESEGLVRLTSIPDMGRAVVDLNDEFPGTRPFVLAQREIAGKKYEIAWRRFWGANGPSDLYAIVGYLVDLEHARRTFIDSQLRGPLREALSSAPNSGELQLTVLDENGEIVNGRAVQRGAPSATGRVDVRFFPVFERRYFDTTVQPRIWTVTVSAMFADRPMMGYWASGTAIILIITSIFCAVIAVKQVRNLARLQSDFVANVSHQLKTPLTVLSGAFETLERQRLKSSDKISEYNQLIRSQISRLSVLVDQILMFSRSTTPQMRVSQLIDVNSLVSRCLSEFKQSVRDGVDVRLESVQASAVIAGDPGLLEDALVNVLDNAVKYSKPPNGINTIVVRTTIEDDEVVVSIKDEGIGINPAEHHRIFEKFFRGRNVGSQTRGFGLGLAIVESAVRINGGRLSVTSRLGVGTEFCIRLPAAQEDAQ